MLFSDLAEIRPGVTQRALVEWKEARRPHVPHHVVHELRFAGHLYQVTLDIEPLSS